MQPDSPTKLSMASLHSETRDDVVSATESSNAKPGLQAATAPPEKA